MRLAGITILIGFACFACTNHITEKRTDGRKKVVCTTGILADAVRQVVDSADVIELMGPGTDPHLFKPTKATLDHLASADVIVANGFHLEGRMTDILEKLSRTKKVIFASDGLDSIDVRYGDVSSQIPDPHFWMDAGIWAKSVAYIATDLQNLVVVKPSMVQDYLDQILDLDADITRQISSIPKDKRILITAHDAFEYFGAAYNIEVMGLQGISTQSDFGVRDVTNMVDILVERKVNAVFIESTISDRSMQAVINGAASQDWKVIQGGTLYTDALGPEKSGADSYIGMMQHNLGTIVKGLK